MLSNDHEHLRRTAIALLMGCLWLVPFCSAQEVEGAGGGGGKGAPALFSSASFLEVTTPITNRVQSNLYGFFLGNVQTSIAMAELPIKVQKYLTITPAYLWVGVPTSGLSLATGYPASVLSPYRENQFRLSASITIPVHHFIISDRNLYVDRYTPSGQVNRYRHRFYVAHPVVFGRFKANAFVYDEIFHDFMPGKWLRRNWAAAGFDLPISRNITLQPMYLRHDDSILRSINFLALGVVVKTGKLFPEK